MKKKQLESKWKQAKAEFKQNYGNVTNDELILSEANFNKTLKNIEGEKGNNKNELLDEIASW